MNKLAFLVSGWLLSVGLNQAEARPTRIAATNISQFQVLGERFTCLNQPRIGIIDRTPLKVGRSWEPANLASIEKQIDLIANSLRAIM
jgi:hypothetical protein